MDAAELGVFLAERTYCVVATTTGRGRAQARPVGFARSAARSGSPPSKAAAAEPPPRAVASLVVSEGEGEAHRAVVADGPVTIHERPPDEVLALGSSASARGRWAVAWLELRRRGCSLTRAA